MVRGRGFRHQIPQRALLLRDEAASTGDGERVAALPTVRLPAPAILDLKVQVPHLAHTYGGVSAKRGYAATRTALATSILHCTAILSRLLCTGTEKGAYLDSSPARRRYGVPTAGKREIVSW
eukprot:2515698-Rhodomonas_salina.5